MHALLCFVRVASIGHPLPRFVAGTASRLDCKTFSQQGWLDIESRVDMTVVAHLPACLHLPVEMAWTLR